MALKLTLKPQEKVIIGGAVIINGGGKAELVIENQVPILRQQEILSLEAADTPCKRIYFVIQLMYVDEKSLAQHHQTYWALVRELIAAAPSVTARIDRINAEILAGRYYQALKLATKLIAYETEVLGHVRHTDGSLQEHA